MQRVDEQVRPAAAAEQSAVARVLSRAFAEDPFLLWVFDRAARRDESSLRFFHWWTSQLMPQGVTWTTPVHEGAAVWALPERWHASATAQVRLVGRAGRGVRHPVRVLRALAQLEELHPQEPHLYLAMLGVDPALQGSGTGARLIAPGLSLADERRWPAYLESSNPRNVGFYERHGFEPLGRIELPAGGPVITRMWRPAR